VSASTTSKTPLASLSTTVVSVNPSPSVSVETVSNTPS
jgi:hypothetical protein